MAKLWSLVSIGRDFLEGISGQCGGRLCICINHGGMQVFSDPELDLEEVAAEVDSCF